MHLSRMLSRRRCLTAAAGAWLVLATRAGRAAPLPTMTVWKDPGCGCCKDWIAILRRDGFVVETVDAGNVAARRRLESKAKSAGDKLTSVEDAVARVADGDRIAVGGCLFSRTPMALVREILRARRTGLLLKLSE